MLADAGGTMSEIHVFQVLWESRTWKIYLMPLESCDLFIEKFHTDGFQVVDAFFRQTDLHTGVSWISHGLGSKIWHKKTSQTKEENRPNRHKPGIRFQWKLSVTCLGRTSSMKIKRCKVRRNPSMKRHIPTKGGMSRENRNCEKENESEKENRNNQPLLLSKQSQANLSPSVFFGMRFPSLCWDFLHSYEWIFSILYPLSFSFLISLCHALFTASRLSPPLTIHLYIFVTIKVIFLFDVWIYFLLKTIIENSSRLIIFWKF